MENIKLILLDLDGTLLLKEGEVPTELNDVIKALNEKGIMLGIATGRYYGSIKKLFKDSYKQMVVVSSNGSAVHVNDELVLYTPYEEELYKKVLDISMSLDQEKIVVQPMKNDVTLSLINDPINKFMEDYGMPIEEVENFSSYTNNINCMCLMTRDMSDYDFKPCFKSLEDKLELLPSGYGCIDIMPKGITKATGIKHLCELLKIETDWVMAIGDAMNDYEMLKTVGLPVAMKNADERIIGIAKLTTEKTNVENGCLEFIKKYFELA